MIDLAGFDLNKIIGKDEDDKICKVINFVTLEEEDYLCSNNLYTIKIQIDREIYEIKAKEGGFYY